MGFYKPSKFGYKGNPLLTQIPAFYAVKHERNEDQTRNIKQINIMSIQAQPIDIEQHQAFAIKRWAQQFENAQSRRTRHLNYTVTPHQDQSLANQRILAHPNGYKALAIWYLIIQCAGRCPQRGLLVDESGPLGFLELSQTINIPEADVREAIAILCDPKVRWIEIVECPRNLVVSGSLRAGRKGRPRRPDVVEVEAREEGPAFYIEKCLTAVVKVVGEEPIFEAERILPPEFESLVRLTQIAEVIDGRDHVRAKVLEHKKEGSTASAITETLPPFNESLKLLERAPKGHAFKKIDAFVASLRESVKAQGRTPNF